MKKAVCLLVFLHWYFIAFSQQEQQYSLYMLNQFVLNPAITGTEDFIDINAGYRAQWVGLAGAPISYYLSAHAAVGKPHSQYHRKGEPKAWHGIGGYVFEDKTGGISRFSFLLAYAYNLPINKNTRLSMGAFGGVKQISTNADHWKNIDDPTDNLFSSSLSSGLKPDLHLGISIYKKELFINFSAYQILGNQYDLPGALENGNDIEKGTFSRHYFFNTGYRFQLDQHTFITPSVMLKMVNNTPLSLDLNAKISHDSAYWLGFSYRYSESVNIFAGLNIKGKLDISYAYEWSFSKINPFNTGTHEIVIGYRIPYNQKVICPSKYW